MPPEPRIIVVSNRLPVVLEKREDARWHAVPSSGGLVSAMVPVLRRRGGVWIGWPGSGSAEAHELDQALARLAEGSGYRFGPVTLTAEEVDDFYYGFSNEVIWPLFHDLFTSCNFEPKYWACYQRVNRKFAEAVAQELRPGDFVWVHDYHLMNVAAELERQGVEARTGFFLHTPFPPLEIFLKLPWRFEILQGLLQFDSLGFQTLRDRRNFLSCVKTLFNVRVEGAGAVVRLHAAGPAGDEAAPMDEPMRLRRISVGAFPIGIDYHAVADVAATEEVADQAERLRADLPGRQIILGVDRLDYTKGLPNKLEAFRNALRRYPELHHKVNLVQHVVPSRSDIPEYQKLRLEMEHLVGEINGEFTASGWVPIHYMYHSLEQSALIAYYRAADIALVTSLKDGMNLVAKEYCAAQAEDDGVLILSEFAGAAAQLQRGALLVNPYDVTRMADRIVQAFRMPPAERRSRMRALRRVVRTQDVYRWADTFLGASSERGLPHLPINEDYLPRAQP